LLADLAEAPGLALDLVSGRSWSTLDEWFGHLPVSLWAEHGFWHRPATGRHWRAAAAVAPDGIGRIKPILDQFAASTPGSHVEIKSASIAWHFRRAQREFGARQAHELRMLLGDALSNQPLEVVEGKKVIEVRLRGASKAMVAHRVLATHQAPPAILAVGDDRTDDDLFEALPEASVKVAVGPRRSRATYRVADYRAVREILEGLLNASRDS
jgi:trehalose 6-phosphate synthase/phosphatase